MTSTEFTIDGVDVFVVQAKNPALSHAGVQKIAGFDLMGVSNRGQKIWPGEAPNIAMTDVFRCRYIQSAGGEVAHKKIIELLQALESEGLVWTHVEKLLRINGQAHYSLMQGE